METSNFIKLLDNPFTRNLLCFIKARQYSNLSGLKTRIFYDRCYVHQVDQLYYANWKPMYKLPKEELKDYIFSWFYDYKPKEGDVILDFGAGIGIDTILFSKCVGKSGKVLSVEAHPKTHHCLLKTCEYNRMHNVLPLNYAVMDDEKLVFIDNSSENEMNAIIEDGNIQVQGKTVDSIVAEENIEVVDFLKMNIEGAEKFAIKGMRKTLLKTRKLCISCHDFLANRTGNEFFRTKKQVIAFLQENDFTVIERLNYPKDFFWIPDMIYARNNRIF